MHLIICFELTDPYIKKLFYTKIISKAYKFIVDKNGTKKQK